LTIDAGNDRLDEFGAVDTAAEDNSVSRDQFVAD
jgi:hypothetical protein